MFHFMGFNDSIMEVQKSGWTWDFVEIAKKSHSCVMLRRLASRRLLLCYRLGDPFGYLFEVISGNAQHKAVKSHTVLKSYGNFLEGFVRKWLCVQRGRPRSPGHPIWPISYDDHFELSRKKFGPKISIWHFFEIRMFSHFRHRSKKIPKIWEFDNFSARKVSPKKWNRTYDRTCD